jgi:hypothetical protein
MTGTHLAPVFPPFSFVVSLRSRRVWHASWYLAFRTTRRLFSRGHRSSESINFLAGSPCVVHRRGDCLDPIRPPAHLRA